MSAVANCRAYLAASHALATSMQPTKEMVHAACTTLAAVLSDLANEKVHILPLLTNDVLALEALLPSQEADDSQKGGSE